MKGLVKANTVDKYLLPIRSQITDIIEPNATVVEFGCGNGDLLFKLSDKIQTGIGLDKSEPLISYACKRKEKEDVDNISFKVIDLTKASFPEHKANYSIASLLFHLLPWESAVELLGKMINISETTIVCGFSEPKNMKQDLLLWLDQRFTNHYAYYKIYKQRGFTEGLLESIGNLEYKSYDTFDPVIKIYKLTSLSR